MLANYEIKQKEKIRKTKNERKNEKMEETYRNTKNSHKIN